MMSRNKEAGSLVSVSVSLHQVKELNAEAKAAV